MITDRVLVKSPLVEDVFSYASQIKEWEQVVAVEFFDNKVMWGKSATEEEKEDFSPVHAWIHPSKW